MQNNQEHAGGSGAFRRFFQEKGYALLLLICAVAVGVSGYIFVSGALSEKKALEEPALSVPAKAALPEAKTPTSAAKASSSKPETAAAVSAPAEQEELPEALTRVKLWPVSGETVSGYSVEELSFNETTRDWRTHDGVDLAAEVGAQVRAAATGTVTAVYDDDYLGTTVVLSHPEGYATHYANLAQDPEVQVGDYVTAGTVLGAVGETALLETAQQPHLHFAVFQGGQPVSPADFIG